MNSYLVEVLNRANLDVSVAARDGKLGQLNKLPSIEALKSALGANADVNNVCNGMCDDPVDIVKEKFTHVSQSSFNFERLKPILIEDRACNNVCNGMCASPEDIVSASTSVAQ